MDRVRIYDDIYVLFEDNSYVQDVTDEAFELIEDGVYRHGKAFVRVYDASGHLDGESSTINVTVRSNQFKHDLIMAAESHNLIQEAESELYKILSEIIFANNLRRDE
jgi:hypothetical protein